MTVAETRYGRRGGGWLPPSSAHELPSDRARPVRFDSARRAHPEEIARGRAHASPARRTAHKCATTADPPGPCDCPPELGALAEVWAGRARMALARQAAGQPLDDIDRQAITRQEPTP